MAVASKRITTTITISGASQEATTESVMGIVDQIILESSTGGQSIDLVLLNENSEEIYRNEGISLNRIRSDLRPRLIPRSAITVKMENPVNVSGTIAITFIEQEHV